MDRMQTPGKRGETIKRGKGPRSKPTEEHHGGTRPCSKKGDEERRRGGRKKN